MIGAKNSTQPLNQVKLVANLSLAFSHALGSLLVFTLQSYWLLVILVFLLIGCCDGSDLALTTTLIASLPLWEFVDNKSQKVVRM